jgi:hypothetical protein
VLASVLNHNQLGKSKPGEMTEEKNIKNQVSLRDIDYLALSTDKKSYQNIIRPIPLNLLQDSATFSSLRLKEY